MNIGLFILGGLMVAGIIGVTIFNIRSKRAEEREIIRKESLKKQQHIH